MIRKKLPPRMPACAYVPFVTTNAPNQPPTTSAAVNDRFARPTRPARTSHSITRMLQKCSLMPSRLLFSWCQLNDT